MTSKSVPVTKLNDGSEIPMLAYGTGTALFKHSNHDAIDRTTVDCIKTALSLGYYHLDGAELYNTEPEIGLAIKESGITRDKLFITTKVAILLYPLLLPSYPLFLVLDICLN